MVGQARQCLPANPAGAEFIKEAKAAQTVVRQNPNTFATEPRAAKVDCRSFHEWPQESTEDAKKKSRQHARLYLIANNLKHVD